MHTYYYARPALWDTVIKFSLQSRAMTSPDHVGVDNVLSLPDQDKSDHHPLASSLLQSDLPIFGGLCKLSYDAHSVHSVQFSFHFVP